MITDPCVITACGINANCHTENDRAVCTCPRELIGNPYIECRPECVINNECNRQQACINNKCVDPCPGTCGQRARCDVVNHNPVCSCPEGYIGDPFVECREQPGMYSHFIHSLYKI